MNAGWIKTKLKNVCELVNGRAYKKDELLAEGKYRVLRVGNFFTNDHWYFSNLELEDKKYCDKGDLLYAWSASFGPRMWAGEKVIFHYHIWKVLPNPSLIDQKFLFHFLLWDMDKIKEDQGAGTTMLHVSKGSMDERDILVPPIQDQQRIVAVLDQAFEGIAKARANAAQNLQNARALFESHLQSVFTQRGEGCTETTLGDVCDVIGGGTPSKANASYFDGDIFWATVRDMKNELLEDTEFKITRDAIKNSSTNIIPKGNVVIATRVGLGKVCFLKNDTAINQDLRGIVPKRANTVNVDFLFYWFKSNSQKIIDEGTGATVQGVKLPFIKSLSINLPQFSEQTKIAENLIKFTKETQRLEALYQRKIVCLDELKKSLLQQAFAGELTSGLHQSLVIQSTPSQPKSMSSTDLHAGILVLAYQKHEEKGNVINFGHVKAEKIAHMLEAKLDIDLGRAPIKAAAGPNDYPHLKIVESRARKAGYFDFKQVNEAAYRVVKLSKFDDLADKTRAFLAEKMPEIDELLELMLPMDTQQAEIFCTVYAAWNNLLLDGQEPTDENIVFEARENWHPDKLKIPREKFFGAIDWMRNKKVFPHGTGKKVLDRK